MKRVYYYLTRGWEPIVWIDLAVNTGKSFTGLRPAMYRTEIQNGSNVVLLSVLHLAYKAGGSEYLKKRSMFRRIVSNRVQGQNVPL